MSGTVSHLDPTWHATLVSAGLSSRAAEAALARFGTLAAVGDASVGELVSAGVPAKTAARVCAAFSVGRASLLKLYIRPTVINCPEDAWALTRERIGTLSQEVFLAIAIDIRNGLIDVIEVARGTLTGVEVHPREVFRPLVRLAAAGVIFVHNHPSGDPTPSSDDLELTRRLKEVGSVLGIPMIDHVVVCATSFRSIVKMEP